MLFSKVNNQIMLTKPSPHQLSAVAVEISSPGKPQEGVNPWAEVTVNIACNKSLKIFVPITFKNTPSVHGAFLHRAFCFVLFCTPVPQGMGFWPLNYTLLVHIHIERILNSCQRTWPTNRREKRWRGIFPYTSHVLSRRSTSYSKNYLVSIRFRLLHRINELCLPAILSSKDYIF